MINAYCTIKFENDYPFNIDKEFSLNKDKLLGKGAFGEIYKGINKITKEIISIKFEKNSVKNKQLKHEYKLLKLMTGVTGFPKIYRYYDITEGSIMIMEYLGANLEVIKSNLKNKKMSVKTSLMTIIQCLERIKSLHQKKFIHRDIKPANFVIGKNNNENLIYLIDFGLSKRYIDERGMHIKKSSDKPIIGTLRYISLNTHKGFEQSRRDDLESIGYLLIYFIKGELPWQNITCKTKLEKYNKIFEMKKKLVPNGLCEFFPSDIKYFFNYILSLNFDQSPDYEMLISILKGLLLKNSYSFDLKFDWLRPNFLSNLYADYNNLMIDKLSNDCSNNNSSLIDSVSEKRNYRIKESSSKKFTIRIKHSKFEDRTRNREGEINLKCIKKNSPKLTINCDKTMTDKNKTELKKNSTKNIFFIKEKIVKNNWISPVQSFKRLDCLPKINFNPGKSYYNKTNLFKLTRPLINIKKG